MIEIFGSSQTEFVPGREEAMLVAERHLVLGSPLVDAEQGQGKSRIVFGMGCFWGAERLFWQQDGVFSTAAGYAGGVTKNPLYKEVCSGQTGHTEVVNVVFDEQKISLSTLLQLFWQRHDPTQGNRQGNDIGSQYRSAIYYTQEGQAELCLSSKEKYQRVLLQSGFGNITTEIKPLAEFYYAEDYHQQYLAKNPGGYCGLAGTGVGCPG